MKKIILLLLTLVLLNTAIAQDMGSYIDQATTDVSDFFSDVDDAEESIEPE